MILCKALRSVPPIGKTCPLSNTSRAQTLTEDIPALFDPNKLLEDKKIGFEYVMAAEQNGEVIGFCCRYACRDADTPYCAEIFSLCVLPKAQHSGIGRAFVEDALAILYISGFKICKVWLPAGNRRSPRIL